MLEAEWQWEHEVTVNRLRKIAYSNPEYENYTFANDDLKNEEASKTCKCYAENFLIMRDSGIGIVFAGNVGVGKTYFSYAICNYLLDRKYSVLATSFSKLIREIESSGFSEKRNQIYNMVESVDLLIIDDLGVERRTEYISGIVYDIVNLRCDASKPLILTTNLDPKDLKKTNDLAYHRIFDRIKKKSIPVLMKGESRRKDIAAQTYNEFKDLLCLPDLGGN